ncbi:NADH-dependent flavin oxidoreductase [Ectobacillus funiculus]|uniref:NADH-dependent flavin oxidoreductase n=1 Tax=Ectobacillus funiculus TaxID=137993 RepID=UPI003978052F
MKEKFKPLFEPFQFRNGIDVKNRIVMGPTTNFSSHLDGTVTDEEVNYYTRRAHGVGMLITACAYVTPNGKGFHGEFGADTDGVLPSLSRLAKAIKDQGAKAILQIFHGGRSCPPELLPNEDLVSASAVAEERDGAPVPRALEEEEVEEIIHAFGEATRRAIEAGFDGIEIHGANGYLIQQFFSPHSNRRTDRWGGNIENRMAFPLAIVDIVKDTVAKYITQPFLIGYRFSPEEPETPGITMTDTLQLVDALANKDLDYLHVSLMEFWSLARRGTDDTRSRIELIVEKVDKRVPIIGVGSIKTPDDAVKAIEAGVEFIALAREIIIEPDWVQKTLEGNEAEINTVLLRSDQEKLAIPIPLWQAIMNTPGWFPVAE